MRFLNKILARKTNNFIMVKIQRKIIKMFNIYYVPTNIQRLPENKYTTNSHLGITDQRFSYQEKIVKNFNNTNNLVYFNSYPRITEMLRKLFLDENLKFNFLDFGGESIDFYLYLKKKFRNINYFVHNKKEINQDFIKLKEKYKFENITVLENLTEISKNKYDFICFGSVVQYMHNYDYWPHFFFRGQLFQNDAMTKIAMPTYNASLWCIINSPVIIRTEAMIPNNKGLYPRLYFAR